MMAEIYMPVNAMPVFARKSPEARREAWNRFSITSSVGLNTADNHGLPASRTETINYRHTLEILWVWSQTTTIKQISQLNESHKFVGFLMHIKFML